MPTPALALLDLIVIKAGPPHEPRGGSF
eukprot:SAG31_NODE_33195_length_346_cov_2.089069_1_plen_27_part_01